MAIQLFSSGKVFDTSFYQFINPLGDYRMLG